jgi:hypothetical protein
MTVMSSNEFCSYKSFGRGGGKQGTNDRSMVRWGDGDAASAVSSRRAMDMAGGRWRRREEKKKPRYLCCEHQEGDEQGWREAEKKGIGREKEEGEDLKIGGD